MPYGARLGIVRLIQWFIVGRTRPAIVVDASRSPSSQKEVDGENNNGFIDDKQHSVGDMKV